MVLNNSVILSFTLFFAVFSLLRMADVWGWCRPFFRNSLTYSFFFLSVSSYSAIPGCVCFQVPVLRIYSLHVLFDGFQPLITVSASLVVTYHVQFAYHTNIM